MSRRILLMVLDVLQVEQVDNAGATPHQQGIALAGRGAVEVLIAGFVLAEEVLADEGTQSHRLDALAEVPSLLA